MSTTGDEPVTAAGARSGALGRGGLGGARWSSTITGWMEHAQDLLAVAVGAILVALSFGILVAAIFHFFHAVSHEPVSSAATDLLEDVLLVLILIEIVHTVVLSLREHALSAEPFLTVGLVAVIRKILFAFVSQQHLSSTQLWIYIGMTAVFVASLVAMRVLDSKLPAPALRPAETNG